MGLKVNDRIYKKRIRKLKRYIRNKLPKESLKEFKENTPRDKGNARSKTKLKRVSSRGFTIQGDYEYSGVLDRGLFPNPPKEGTGKTKGGYSTQAPKGMVDPTTDFIEKEIRDFIRRI